MTADESVTIPETSRRIFLRKGLLVGAGAVAVGIASTMHADSALAASTDTALAIPSGEQFDWAWCYQCQGLYYGPWELQARSYCPIGGPHAGYHQGSLDYALYYGNAGTGGYQSQPNWQICSKCSGLFYPNDGNNYCPTGGTHNVSPGIGSYNYKMLYNVPANSGLQAGWSWCHNCQGLFYGPNWANSWCPKYSGTEVAHDGAGSYNYAML